MSYIGVTGFMSREEVEQAEECMEKSRCMLMIGVLVSSKTLAGQPNRWPHRFPLIEHVGEVFSSNQKSLNLIHYSTDEPSSLGKQLTQLVKIGGPLLHGFQLNIAWPALDELQDLHEKTRSKHYIVLQIGRKAMQETGDSPEAVAEMVSRYEGFVDDILLDPSGGKGEPFDPEKARLFLRAIQNRKLAISLGIAGGLSQETLYLVQSLTEEFPELNIDAEGRLRDPATDNLNLEKMSGYLKGAREILD